MFQYSHSATGDGLLDWHGWSSTAGVKSVKVSSAMWIVMDSLQASASVPDAGQTGVLLCLGLFGLAAARKAVV